MRRRRSERQHLYRSAEYRDLVGRLAAGIRNLREQNGWTQEVAAEHASLATPLLQRIEAGSSNVTITTIARLCKGFKVDILGLFTLDRAGSSASRRHSGDARRQRKV